MSQLKNICSLKWYNWKISFKSKEDNMRKVELSLKEKQKYEIIKKLVETNGY